MESAVQAGRRLTAPDKTILEKLLAARAVLRTHRDARGDDRCWLDDYAVWALVPGSFPVPLTPPPFEEAMDMCRGFYKFRRADAPDVPPPEAITDPARWDDDITGATDAALAEKLSALLAAVRVHRDAACRGLTVADDRALYAVLPEKLPADFRLPPVDDFLGEGKAPLAGCPSFWRSHAACTTARHDLHRWGPCAAPCNKVPDKNESTGENR